MSSRSKNFRRRADDGDDENEGDPKNASAPSTEKPSSKPSSAATKANKPKQKLLSFANDEDTESPLSRPKSSKPSSRLSKPSSSHKITTSKERHASTLLPSNVQPQAGTYTKEALLELQKNTRTLARPSSDSKPKTHQASEPIIVLKGLVKPVEQIVKESQELDSDEDEDGAKDKRGGLFGEDTESKLANMGIGNKKDPDSIPDQATIEAIRRKRERMRQSRAAAPDYIALDSGSNHGAAEGLSDEEPEFQGRIALFGEKKDSGRKGVFEDDDDEKVEGPSKLETKEYLEEDEEEKIWEEEQFRKGLGKRMDDGSGLGVGTTSSIAVVHTAQQQKLMFPGSGQSTAAHATMTPPNVGGAGSLLSQGLDVMSIPQQAEVARQALEDNLRRLKESHSRTMNSLAKTDENLSASLSNIITLEKSLTAAGEKFIFMQKLRDFVSVICDFLQHKAPYIEELEEQMQKLHEERASSIIDRRAADNDDEMKEIEAAINAAMREFSKGGSSTAMISAAARAAQVAAAAMQDQKDLPVKLDEFGRDMNQQKRMDMKRRAEDRQRRKARFEAKRMSAMELDGAPQKIEGESSTDESDSETSAYESNRDQLLQTAGQIFSDASEEYSQLSLVKEKFDRWKKEYASSYRDAYMSLNTLAIFSPYVRLELLKWDPLHEDVDFFDMKWHSLLFSYGLPEDGSDFAPGDPDADLIPGLVEKVALPILHHEIEHCWDMLSTQETRNAVSATNMVINYVPASSEALAELLVAVRTRLADAVANIMVPSWSPMVLQAVPNAARIAAYRFGMSVRLLRNICLWKEILALPVLEKLALEELLSRKVLPHVESIRSNIHDAVTRTERIIASLSGVWSGPSVTGDHSRKLQPLVGLVMSLAENLKKRQGSGVTDSEVGGLARRLKKMLVDLNDYDKARAIARTFNLKEAL